MGILSDYQCADRFPDIVNELIKYKMVDNKENIKLEKTTTSRRLFIRIWHKFCRLTVKVFYRRVEIVGQESIPKSGGLILCANHINALADVVILQASTDKNIRPLARSGLFEKPFLRPILDMIGAVPIYRKGDKGSNLASNKDTFRRCYELLAEGETLIIFPEGQSHSDPFLHDLKTGAARMALGSIDANNIAPIVLPVGLTFTSKGKFRSDVLIHYGTPVDLKVNEKETRAARVHLINERITEGLAAVTLNAQSWKELILVDRLERFFALRHGKYRHRDLSQRFNSLQRLIKAKKLLQDHEPDKVRSLVNRLKMFERLCRCCGIKNYHLGVKYHPVFIALYLIRMISIILIGYPLAVWGMINSFIPYQLTRMSSRVFAKGWDQQDTTKMLIGLILFILFWGIQTFAIYHYFGGYWAIAYLTSLIVGAYAALKLKGEYKRIIKDLKVFFLFLRKRELKEYLIMKRKELEVELARLVRIAKGLSTKSV